MKRKIIGLLTIFLIFIIRNTYSSSFGAQGGFLGSGVNLGGILDPLEATVLMPHIISPLQFNVATPIDTLGIGILPQTNLLMDPIIPPLIPGGVNNILLNPGIEQPVKQVPINGIYDVGILGFGLSESSLLVPETSMYVIPGAGNSMVSGVEPIIGFNPGTVISFGHDPMINFGFAPTIGFGPGSMGAFGPGFMTGFAPGPMMGLGLSPMMVMGPLSMIGLAPGPMMDILPISMIGIGAGPMINMPDNMFSLWDLTPPFNNLSPILNYPYVFNNDIPTNTTANNPKQGPGAEQSGNKRVIFLGTSIEGTRADGTPYIVKHYLDTFTGKQICGYSQGVELPAPDYNWWYGCAPTSSGMMMGYYDIYGYNGITYDLVLGGVAELSSFYPNSPYPIDLPLDPPSPLGPTLLCNKAIASSGHLADFWLSYGGTGDPLASGRIIPSQFDCLADFMGTSQDNLTSTGQGNPDGQTFFYFWTDGSRMTNIDLFNLGYDVYNYSGTYGMIEYTQYCGYRAFAFNQYILGSQSNTLGFSFSDYVNEIDAGRPVMIHLTGHMMLGVGYYLTTETVIVHDAWNNSNLVGPLTMTWGGTYQDPDGTIYSHYAVTCFTPL